MQLVPGERVDGLGFDTSPAALQHRLGRPRRLARNGVGLNEWDYGEVVYRFEDSGPLEEVTRQVPVLYLGAVAVPFQCLAGFVQTQDEACFRRAGFWVSPRFGLAFDPGEPCWLTALAWHCLPQWRAL